MHAPATSGRAPDWQQHVALDAVDHYGLPLPESLGEGVDILKQRDDDVLLYQ